MSKSPFKRRDTAHMMIWGRLTKPPSDEECATLIDELGLVVTPQRIIKLKDSYYKAVQYMADGVGMKLAVQGHTGYIQYDKHRSFGF